MRLIDADALIKELKHITDAYGGDDGDAVVSYYDPLVRRTMLVNLEEFIKRCPTIDPVKHGKWMPHPTEPDWDVCSVCGIGTMRRTHGYHNGAFWDAEENYSYCPHCGARMNE